MNTSSTGMWLLVQPVLGGVVSVWLLDSSAGETIHLYYSF